MTPTLLGRWQTRFLLFHTVGLLVTLPICLVRGIADPFWILEYIFLLGLGWDLLYDYLQKFRWDRDWPGAFQLLAGLGEGLSFVLLRGILQLPLPGTAEFNLTVFVFHYSLVWLAIYLTSQSLMRILFPRWRFRGGQWL